MSDPESGVSIGVPPTWKQYDPEDSQQQTRFDELVSQAGNRHPVGFNTQGASPDLMAIDTSLVALQQTTFTYFALLHTNTGEQTSMDQLQELARKQWPALNRVELPSGPALVNVQNNNGWKQIMYMMLGRSVAYTFRFSVSDAAYKTDEPLVEQMMETARFAAPDAKLAQDIRTRKAAELQQYLSRRAGLGGNGAGPPDRAADPQPSDQPPPANQNPWPPSSQDPAPAPSAEQRPQPDPPNEPNLDSGRIQGGQIQGGQIQGGQAEGGKAQGGETQGGRN